MSTWMHIAGTVRIDGFLPDKKDEEKYIDEVLGKGDFAGEYITYYIIRNDNEYSVNTYNVLICGDIKHCDGFNEISKWFHEICKSLNVRQAVLMMECDNRDSRILRYETKSSRMRGANYKNDNF